MWKRLLIVALLCMPVAAWAFIKPIRVLAPEWNGVSCINDSICTDEPSRNAAAEKLYGEALGFVDTSVGMMETRPRVIFCQTEACARAFGVGKRAGMTVGRFASVISPRAWNVYYLRHEMIHHLQNERLGMLRMLREPKWFTEGMAYALSEDPRQKLNEPFQGYRDHFRQWYKAVGKQQLWQAAQDLKRD